MTSATVALIGAGAIGTAIASRLDSSITSLSVFRHHTTRPLRIALPSGEEHWLAASYRYPDEAEPVDWVLLATKAQQTPSAGPLLGRIISKTTRVVVLQNGIRHADRVANWVPTDRVVPAAVFVAATRRSPDVIEVQRFGEVLVPESASASELIHLFRPPSVVRADPEFERENWRKLILNAAFNSITALTLAPASVRACRDARELLIKVLREGVAIANASGVEMSPAEEQSLMAAIDALPAAFSSSMKTDREAGHAMEHEYLTGALVRQAMRVGVVAPTLNTLHKLLVTLDAQRRPEPGSPVSASAAVEEIRAS